MADRSSNLQTWAPRMLSVLRIVAALIFLEHGTLKLLGFPAGPAAQTAVAFGTLPWLAGVIELVAGVLLALGLFTRVAAFVASGEMAVAYWIAHAPQSPFPAVKRRSSTASCSSTSCSPIPARGA